MKELGKEQLGNFENEFQNFPISKFQNIRMKQFLSFVKKEFHHIFRDKRTMLILLGMPIIQIIIFGFALTNEVKDSGIGVYDQSKDVATVSLIQEIESSQYFNIRQYLFSY